MSEITTQSKDRYFNNLVNGVKTVFEGMSITLASFFTRPVTVQYPEADISTDQTIQDNYKGPLSGMPPNYRGILNVDMSICTACTLCMKACPIDCIYLETVKCEKVTVIGKDGNEENKVRTCSIFKIDIGKCMFCGLCTIPCKPGSIYHTNRFEMNTQSLDKLVLSFVDDDSRQQILLKGMELDAIAEAKKKEKQALADKKAAEEQAVSKKTDKEKEPSTTDDKDNQ
ncbi:MAG: 4Fe-4S binding protein [Deltaproteobacteria bacterium]|nr:4Fe-4S binding protein [Deltaproteobacteria bacterium]